MSLFPIIRSTAYYNKRRAVNTCGNPRWREPRPCSSWGQVAHVLTLDNFLLSLGQKDFAAPQGLPSRSRGMTRCAAMPTVRCRRLTIITGTTADRSAHAIKPVSSPRGMQRRPRRPRNLHPARDRGDMVVTGLAPAGVLFGFGVLLIATGLFYGLLIPVQPMKAVLTDSLTSRS